MTVYGNVHGAPGTGKTTWLTEQFVKEAKKWGRDRVSMVSYTRAAGGEFAFRASTALGIRDSRSGLPYVGTIHALAYAALGRPPLVGAKEYGAFCLAEGIAGPRSGRNDDTALDLGDEDTSENEEGAVLRRIVAEARHRHIAVDVAAARHRDFSPDRMAFLAERYKAWKSHEGLLDFEDLLVQGMRKHLPVKVLFVDEAQDCQPAGTAVLVSTGRGVATRYSTKNIEDVCVGDRVVSYNRKGLQLSACSVEGLSSRYYEGSLITIKTDTGQQSRYTPEHHCVVRIGPAFANKHVVYIMRRGSNYRVGVSSAYRDKASCSTGIKGRMSEEGADAAWALAVFDSRKHARLLEEMITAEYGIPQMRFVGGDTELADLFWKCLDGNEDKALRCLWDFGRDLRYPLCTRGSYFLYSRAIVMRACNLMDGMTVLTTSPVLSRKNRRVCHADSAWRPVTVSTDRFKGEVYSLSISRDHTYVGDEIVTHNCSPLLWAVLDHWAEYTDLFIAAGDPWQAIYVFAGADPSLFRDRKGKWLSLEVSHRLTHETAEYAKAVLRDGDWDDPLFDKWHGAQVESSGPSTLYLARTHKLLAGVRERLMREGEPFGDYTRKAPLRTVAADSYRTLTNLLDGQVVGWSEFKNAAQYTRRYMPAGVKPRRGIPAKPPYGSVSAVDADYWLGDTAVAREHIPNGEYFKAIEKRYGNRGLWLRPDTMLSTIHGAKGREASHVKLVASWGWLPSQSLRDEAGRKREALVAYVAATRHKTSFELIEGGFGKRYPWPGGL